MLRPVLLLACSITMLGCGSESALFERPHTLRFNEIVSDNEGVWVDELGEADDYIEVINVGNRDVELSDFAIVDSSGTHELPAGTLAPNAVKLFFADDRPDQGPDHLPFKVSASGESLTLVTRGGSPVDAVEVPALAGHHAYARVPDGRGEFVDCGWATPGRTNGQSCGPTSSTIDPDDVSFAEFVWPEEGLGLPAPLAITELGLRPARFVELHNTSSDTVDLSEFALSVAPHRIGEAWPRSSDGSAIPLPAQELEAGERLSVEVSEADVSDVAAEPNFEGVLTLSRAEGGTVDRVDFSAWPDGAVLARYPDGRNFRFCSQSSEGEANDRCSALASRPLGDRARALSTPDDFRALSAGRHGVGAESVEFLIDVLNGDVVALLNAGDWDLHYTFVREAINGQPHLDRCDPVQAQEFQMGWWAFSEIEYFQTEGRRYLLGTLVRHAGAGLDTVQFSPGDTITAAQMKHAFFTMMKHVENPKEWYVRPQTPDQVERIRAVEGELPIVGPNAPFRGVTFQPLTPAVAYGTLRFVPASDVRKVPLGPRDVVITDQVPNDIPLIGGLITESFQTPLAHVNILSRGRGTPNMALKDARLDPRISPFIGQLVRLEVTGADFTLELAESTEALAFWESRKPEGPPLTPGFDDSARGVQPLDELSAADIPKIGGKAAQLAELGKVELCAGAVSTPELAFAIPLVHSREHFIDSGAREVLDMLEADPEFLADPLARARGLAEVRELVQSHPVEPALLEQVITAIGERFPGVPLRFRSSSNTEDLAGFNGAGLYTSVGLDPDEVPGEVEEAIQTVWASLFTTRAYDERTYYNVEQSAVAMGVLIHPAYESERVNGVAVSRDVLDPSRGDRYYINAQIGEALVTNPAPGVSSDQFTYAPGGWQPLVQHSHSTFSPLEPVMSEPELEFLSCNLERIHDHFRAVLDPEHEMSWFAVDIEFKLMGPERALVIKQARPYSFGSDAPTSWCDF